AMNKTKIVDFNKEDFSFVGFDFKHWRENKKGEKYFMVSPTMKSLKDFKKKIKDKTVRKLTLGKEEWVTRVNPIIRGKVNYYLNIHKAVQLNLARKQKSHCYIEGFSRDLHSIDSYVRQRLRMCMIHTHPSVRKAYAMTTKWNIEFFCKIGLVPSSWYYYNKIYGYKIEQYVERQTKKNKEKYNKRKQKLESQGVKYYTEDRKRKMANAKRIALT
ncbi:hypothetical protein J2Z34_002462, partial [Youngiibacter multivorans]|nr:hypothetical protein [Youngiibacter multivorans]